MADTSTIAKSHLHQCAQCRQPYACNRMWRKCGWAERPGHLVCWLKWWPRWKATRLLKKALYRLTNRLNERRDTCWIDLVCWIEFGPFSEVTTIAPFNRFRDPLFVKTVARCRDDARKDGVCYCGKFCTQAFLDEHSVHLVEDAPRIIVGPEMEPEDEDVLISFKPR